MATIATTPNASVKTLLSDCKTTQAPIAKGKINEEVNGPDATPPDQTQ